MSVILISSISNNLNIKETYIPYRMAKKTLEETITKEEVEKTLESLAKKFKKDPYTVEIEYKHTFPFAVIYHNKIIKKEDIYKLDQKRVYEEMLEPWKSIEGKDAFDNYCESQKDKFREIIKRWSTKKKSKKD